MAGLTPRWGTALLMLCVMLALLPGKADAFGAGNIPSIGMISGSAEKAVLGSDLAFVLIFSEPAAQVEGHNWRHGGWLLSISKYRRSISADD